MTEIINVFIILVGKSEGKRPQGNLGIDGRIILRCVLNCVCSCKLGSYESDEGLMAGFCECSNEFSGSVAWGYCSVCFRRCLGRLIKEKDGMCFAIPIIHQLSLACCCE
jgi:hypothetical protein